MNKSRLLMNTASDSTPTMAVTRLLSAAVGVEFNLPLSSGKSGIWTHHNP
jgi:hypothetical protein